MPGRESDRQFAARMTSLLEADVVDVRDDDDRVIDLRDEVRFTVKAMATLPVLAPVAWGAAQLLGHLPH